MTTQTLQVRAERVDDIPLLLGFLQQMNLPTILEEHLGSHHLHQGLSNGWLATVWIAFILSEANHCKVSVQEWANAHHHLLTTLLGQPIRPVEFSDDRLSIILRRLHEADWNQLETALWHGTCQVYEVPVEVVRLDGTTSYGYHQTTPEGLLQFGHSKDHRPDLPQFKLMAAAAQPTSQLIACDIVPGNSADDPLYVPLMDRVRSLLGRKGLLYAGDCKMAALATRASVVAHHDYYLMPLPRTGETAAEWDQWIDAALQGQQPLQELRRVNEEDEIESFGRGYEFVRECAAEIDEITGKGKRTVRWRERVQVVQSLALAERQARQLEQRLAEAEKELRGLTRPPGRGIRPYWTEASLRDAITEIEKRRGVEGMLEVSCEKVSEGSGGRSVRPRYMIQEVRRVSAVIQARKERLGWRVQVTNLPRSRYDLQSCVLIYNGGWSVERDFHLIKDKPLGIQPLYVREEEQIGGMIRLLTIALRVQTLFELVVRVKLESAGEELAGLYEGQSKRSTARPTAVRILKAICRMNLSVIEVKQGSKEEWHLTALPPLLRQILSFVGVALEVYTCLATNTG